jgi:hypothetical protein
MMSSSVTSRPKLNLPSPYDVARLNQGLNKTPAQQKPLEPYLQQQQELQEAPPPQPRVGSTQAIIKQREQLTQDVFQRQTVQDVNYKRSALEVPIKDQSFSGQLQQLSNTTRQFLAQLDRLNISATAQRQAQGTMLQSQEGRHQVHHQHASLFMKLKEPSVITKSKREEDVVRRRAKDQRMGIRPTQANENTEFNPNLAVSEDEKVSPI